MERTVFGAIVKMEDCWRSMVRIYIIPATLFSRRDHEGAVLLFGCVFRGIVANVRHFHFLLVPRGGFTPSLEACLSRPGLWNHWKNSVFSW